MTRRLYVLLFVCLVLAASASAQSFRGSMQGTVTDATGASISGAEVKIVHAATGLTRLVTTSVDGNFTATELPPGAYDLTITKQGFRSGTVKGVEVSVSSVARANIKLTPGEVQETVQVSAEVPLIEVSSNTMGGTIEAKQVVDLPVNGRDFTKLLVLVPGATGDPVGSTDSPGSFGLFSVNGNRGRSNNYLLDGTDMNDGYRNLPSINQAGVFGTPATVLPVEALAEVPVLSGAEAEYGRNSGAIVNLVTKSGTNNLHGTLYGFIRDDRFDARNYFNTKPGAKDHFHNDQFGLSLGGPLVKDRTFWFLAYEGQREHGSLPTPGTVPTLADIAAATPAGGINPVIQKILNTKPWGTLPASGTGETIFSTPFYNRVDSFIGKVDQHIGAADLFTARYFFGDSKQAFPLGLVGGGNSAPGFDTVTPTRVNILSLSYTKVVSPALLMELRGGWNRFHEDFFAQDNTFDPRTIGLMTLGSSATSRDFGLPLVAVGSFSSFGSTPSVPRGRIDTNYQLFGNASYTVGKHAWKFGYEFRRTDVNGWFDAGYRGKLVFDDLASFLSGTPSGGRSAAGDSNRQTYQNNHGFYLQDNWRVTSRLTFNYGLRWDYYGVIGEKKNQFSILNTATGALVHPDLLYPRDLNNFAPRVSFAYDLTGKGKTVIRAGWGVYYDAFSQDFFVGQLPWNTFNPGPAYNDIQFSFSPQQIAANTPVYTDYAATDVFTVDQKMRTPYIQNYNLNFEHQVGNMFAIQLGYVGSAGRKLFRYRDINQVNPATGTQAFPAFIYINQFEATAASSYNSLQSSLRMRNWHGVTSTLNYTWGHSIDDASDGQDYVPNAAQPDNSFNPRAERASSNFDTRHRLQWFWSFELPKYNYAPRLTNGWALNGIVTYATGQPYNVNYMFEDDYNGSGEFYGRPDLIGNPFAGVHTPDQFLNLSAFAAPCTIDVLTGSCVAGTQHFGNVGRNAFRGSNYSNFDFGVSKNTKLSERVNMQLRVDFFNILNHPNFSNPLLPNFSVDIFTNPAQVVSVNGKPRLAGSGFLPIVATPDVGTGNPFLGGGGPRNLQFGLKFSF